MPNYCSNVMIITSPDKALVERAANAYGKGSLLNEFVPVPQEMIDNNTATSASDAVTQSLKEVFLEKYGFESWYDFCNEKWGTKWDICDSDGHAEVTACHDEGETPLFRTDLRFNTAWSPPFTWCETFLKDFPDCTVQLYYYEPGMCFAGMWENGKHSHFDDIVFTEEGLAELPAELVDMFDMWEDIEDCEEELDDEPDDSEKPEESGDRA